MLSDGGLSIDLLQKSEGGTRGFLRPRTIDNKLQKIMSFFPLNRIPILLLPILLTGSVAANQSLAQSRCPSLREAVIKLSTEYQIVQAKAVSSTTLEEACPLFRNRDRLYKALVKMQGLLVDCVIDSGNDNPKAVYSMVEEYEKNARNQAELETEVTENCQGY